MPDNPKKTISPKALSSEDRAFWNSYIDHLEKKGLKGSPKLDAADLSRAEFDAYVQQSGKPYNYDEFIPSVQAGIIDYRNRAIENIKNGAATWSGYKGDGNFDGFMANLSALDGLAGQYTTGYKFPAEVIPVKNLTTGVVDQKARNTTYDLEPSKFKRMSKAQ